MSASPAKTALYGIFHSVYESKATGLPISHIFSAVIRPGKRSYDAFVQDYSGKGAYVRTDCARSKFNLAALVPIPAENARALTTVVDRINEMGERGVWPFYFSIDMSVRPDQEAAGQLAISPEGQIDPAPRLQNTMSYWSIQERGLTRARINCVRMTMLAAGLAGIDVPKIADIEACFTTGEEVRDCIREAAARYKIGRKRNAEARGVLPLFGQKDMGEGQVIGSASGLSIIESCAPVTLNKFVSTLSRKVEGRTMFDWLSKGKALNFVTDPQDLPAYLEKAMDLAVSVTPDPSGMSEYHAALAQGHMKLAKF